MNVDSLISECKYILTNVNNPKVLEEFTKYSKNQDVVICCEITENDIKEFTNRMLDKFRKYLDVEEK